MFCNNVDGSSTNTKKLKRELKENSSKFFSEGLGFCLKVKAKFDLKEDVTPIFRPKRQRYWQRTWMAGKIGGNWKDQL